jgi:hypothetical protein
MVLINVNLFINREGDLISDMIYLTEGCIVKFFWYFHYVIELN